jgi:hypothetical protein
MKSFESAPRRRFAGGRIGGLGRWWMHHRVAGIGVVAAGVVAVVALASVLAFGTGRQQTGAPSTAPAPTGARSVASALPLAVVKIRVRGRAIAVPRSYLGISTEYWTIPVWAQHLSVLGRVLASISPDGPMLLRIGGSSADQTRWAPSTELPEWVFEITPAWLRQVRSIVDRFRVRVILDLNLVTATPTIAVRWARIAEAALPSESIVGFEIGNEADIYSLASWRKTTTGGTGSTPLPNRLTASGYARSYQAYAKALIRLDPGVPLLGPALSDPAAHLSWISRLLAGPHPGLRAITVHRYPLSACSRPGAETFPTIARVLSETATAGMARTIENAVRAARRADLPVRLTELNSVTCGGRKGVSNTFATALWAPDALFELLNAGAISAAVHVRARAVNMAFSLTRRGLVADPLFYGLALFARTLGPNSQLLPVALQARPGLRLKAWAVRVGANTLHILLIDKSTRAVRVSLEIPATGPVTAQRLLARSARATSGVTLGGQHLDAQGRWVGASATETLRPGGGGYPVTVRGLSATLVTATVPTGALAATPRR